MKLEEAYFVYVSLCVMVCVCSISYEHQSGDICCPLLAGKAQHARLPSVFPLAGNHNKFCSVLGPLWYPMTPIPLFKPNPLPPSTLWHTKSCKDGVTYSLVAPPKAAEQFHCLKNASCSYDEPKMGGPYPRRGGPSVLPYEPGPGFWTVFFCHCCLIAGWNWSFCDRC